MHITEFQTINHYMLSQMKDSAHDSAHISRVLYAAMDIASTLQGVDLDVVIAAALLHDIGRERQFQQPELCHAQVGGEMAYDFLISICWKPEKAELVQHCIAAHRYRSHTKPQTLEAKILFDADKLDVTGALGIARTLLYAGQVGELLYTVDDQGRIVTDGISDHEASTTFVQEFNYKLKNLYDGFYTNRAKQIAEGRQPAAIMFYQALYQEIQHNHKQGQSILDAVLQA